MTAESDYRGLNSMVSPKKLANMPRESRLL
jgi:hypothetical protein